MFNISDYFQKFAKIEGDSLAERDAIIKALREICGVANAKFEVKKKVLYITGSPVMKSTIHMRKAALLTALQASIANRVIDIR